MKAKMEKEFGSLKAEKQLRQAGDRMKKGG